MRPTVLYALAAPSMPAEVRDADGGDLLPFRHPGGLGGVLPGDQRAGAARLIFLGFPVTALLRLEFLQQLAGPLDGPRSANLTAA
ncbi:hypothetical protein ACCT13_22560 [Rhizobium ruizarguesonis]